MVNMENAEEVMQILDRFTRLKQKEIPKELDEYLQYVAKTGDTVFKWSSLKYLFREKLLNVIKHFHDTTPRVDEIPQYPNVDPFNYESMKSSLLERLELFNAAPFTIQRLCELLIDPRKQYSRIDKFMRALEKNILVVSTIEPGRKRTESENGDSLDSVVNGDLSLDVNVDIDMENESLFNMEAQNGNGNGTGNGSVAAAEVAAAEADSAAEAKAEDATAETKEKEKPAETTNVKHATRDDEILPNPKKAKLELEKKEEKDKEQESEASEVTEAQQAAKAETEAEAKTEQKADDKKDVDDAEMQEDDKPVVLKEVQEKNETLKEQEEEEAKNKEKEKSEVEQEKEKENVEEKKKPEDEKQVLAKEAEIAVEQAETEVDAGKKVTVVPEVEKEKENNEEEKIIEKQEFEKCEKEEKLSTPAVEAAEVQADVASAVTKEKEQKDAIIEVIGDHAENKPLVKNDDKLDEVAATLATDIADSHVKTATSIPQELSEGAKIAAAAVVVEEQKSEAEIPKIANDNATESAANTKTQAEKTETEQVETPVDEKIATTNVETATPATVADKTAAEAAPAAGTSDDAESANAVVDAVLPAAGADAVAAVTTTAEVQSAGKENIPAVVSETVAVAPTLALNDQPMEDVPLEEALPTIDEVVMAETGGATAMATDTIEPAKDEPAGMEVDDTSQEAMDQ